MSVTFGTYGFVWSSSFTVEARRTCCAVGLHLIDIVVPRGTVCGLARSFLAESAGRTRSSIGSDSGRLGGDGASSTVEAFLTQSGWVHQARHITEVAWQTVLAFRESLDHGLVVEGSCRARNRVLCLLCTVVTHWTDVCIPCDITSRGFGIGAVFAVEASITWSSHCGQVGLITVEPASALCALAEGGQTSGLAEGSSWAGLPDITSTLGTVEPCWTWIGIRTCDAVVTKCAEFALFRFGDICECSWVTGYRICCAFGTVVAHGTFISSHNVHWGC